MITSFVTGTGIEVPSISAAQMREVDRRATRGPGPSLLQMMENAGRSLALTAIEMLGPAWMGKRVVVLAGGGGNGGGGICAARHLANRDLEVTLCIQDTGRLGIAGAQQARTYDLGEGCRVTPTRLRGLEVDLVIDAVTGYGLTGPLRGAAARMIEWANERGAPILALDVPSGVDATSGETPGTHARASRTLTLALPKTGLIPSLTGPLVLADLGIAPGVYRDLGIDYADPFGAAFRVALVSSGQRRDEVGAGPR